MTERADHLYITLLPPESIRLLLRSPHGRTVIRRYGSGNTTLDDVRRDWFAKHAPGVDAAASRQWLCTLPRVGDAEVSEFVDFSDGDVIYFSPPPEPSPPPPPLPVAYNAGITTPPTSSKRRKLVPSQDGSEATQCSDTTRRSDSNASEVVVNSGGKPSSQSLPELSQTPSA